MDPQRRYLWALEGIREENSLEDLWSYIQGDQKFSVRWKSQCVWTIPTQLMIWRWPSQNTFEMWTVLYWTRSKRTQFGVSINIWRMVGDTAYITCSFLYWNQVHRDFLITLCHCRIRYNYELLTPSEDGDTITLINVRRLNWIGHIDRMDNARNSIKISSKAEGVRTRGRTGSRWWDDFWTDLQTECCKTTVGSNCVTSAEMCKTSWH
jgi:hypothetical protein